MILEGLVTTLGLAEEVNIAPMGPEVAEQDVAWQTFLLKPFRTSQTFANLQQHGEGVLHVTDDVLLLARAALGSLDPLPELQPALHIRGRVLKHACRWYEFRLISSPENCEPVDRPNLLAQVVHIGRGREFFGLNRAKHAVVEAAILATRTHLLPIGEVLARYRELVPLVEKTGGTQEREAFALLQAHVQHQQNQQNQQVQQERGTIPGTPPAANA